MKKAMDSLENVADKPFFAFVKHEVENGATWKYSTELPEAYLMVDGEMSVILYFSDDEPFDDFETSNTLDTKYFAWESSNKK